MLESLLDNFTTKRIEIDMIEFSGIEFRHVDNRVMSLKLVQLGLSGAAMFGPSGEVLKPSEILRIRADLPKPKSSGFNLDQVFNGSDCSDYSASRAPFLRPGRNPKLAYPMQEGDVRAIGVALPRPNGPFMLIVESWT